jgi:hypothetical protein
MPMRYELPPAHDRPIWDIWLSMYQLPAMAIADELEIFRALEHGSATTAEIAQRLELNQRAVDVLFSMLSALGLASVRNGSYELTVTSRTYLLPGSPYYWGPLLRTLGVLPQQRAALIKALRSADDGATWSSTLPSKSWERGQMDRAQAESVSRIMHCHSLPAAVGVAQSGIFDDVRRLLDVGGGSGCFSIAIAQHLARIRCDVMDLPAVCDVARGYIENGGVSDRVGVVPGDMFNDAWPRGYDGLFFSNVFHDWNVQTNLSLARRAYDALADGGQIFLHEMLLADDGSGPVTTASFSILLLFGTRGRQYTFRELRQVLGDAGFVDIGARETYGYYSIVSGRKP